MNEQKKQKLLEQYDDAAFALLMDEYAEEEGARLMAEFEAAQAAGQVPEMPRELDEQCRRMIRRNSAKKRGRQAARRFGKVAVKAAVAVLVFIGLMTTVVMSVDALRVPILNYITELQNRYTSVQFIDSSEFQEFVSAASEVMDVHKPADYYEIAYKNVGGGLFHCIYQNDEGMILKYSTNPASAEFRFDTEDAEYDEISIYSYDGYLVRKDGVHIIWIDGDNSLVNSLYATSMEESVLLDLAYHIAECGLK